MPDASYEEIAGKCSTHEVACSTHEVACSTKGCEYAAHSIYKAFHPEKFIQCIKK